MLSSSYTYTGKRYPYHHSTNYGDRSATDNVYSKLKYLNSAVTYLGV